MDQPTFANEPIGVGDILFDSSDGPVIVLELFPDRIAARLLGKDQRRVVYSYKGVQGRRSLRTLYWHDPDCIEPMKDPAAWQLQKNFMREINATFSRYIRANEAIRVAEVDETN